MQYAGTRIDRGVVRERKDTRRGEIDLPFAALTLLLLTTGVVMVASTSERSKARSVSVISQPMSFRPLQ